MLVHLDYDQKKARLLLKAQPVLQTLMEEEEANPKYVLICASAYDAEPEIVLCLHSA